MTATASKTSLKKWICAASNFIALIPSRLILRMLANFLEADSKGLHQSSAKEKESCCFVFPSLTSREIRHFHVLVVQWRQRNVQKSLMMGSKGGAVVRALASHQCGFESWRRRHMWVEFVVGSLPCSERFFSGYSGFPLSLKTNTFKFQFDLERTDTFQRVLMNSLVIRG